MYRKLRSVKKTFNKSLVISNTQCMQDIFNFSNTVLRKTSRALTSMTAFNNKRSFKYMNFLRPSPAIILYSEKQTSCSLTALECCVYGFNKRSSIKLAHNNTLLMKGYLLKRSSSKSQKQNRQAGNPSVGHNLQRAKLYKTRYWNIILHFRVTTNISLEAMTHCVSPSRATRLSCSNKNKRITCHQTRSHVLFNQTSQQQEIKKS